MLIYFAGPTEHRNAALAASQYSCTRVVNRLAEADAVILVWDGHDVQVEALRNVPHTNRLVYLYRIPYN